VRLSVESTSNKRVKVSISGIVQGVGFRPFIYQLAHRYALGGYVNNDGSGVVVEVEGMSQSIDSFLERLNSEPPPLAQIHSIVTEHLEVKGEKEFKILESSRSHISTLLLSDIALCSECLAEMRDPKNRRYRYPFINCTNCGPRYTITKALPYDRVNTSMAEFEMCDACRAEYQDPNSRRYHAQPISCYDCGPKLKLLRSSSNEVSYDDVIQKAVELLDAGHSIALKGLGGFHIICDATNERAVASLRYNKHRPTKPLAVMFDTIESIKKVAHLSQKDEELLCSAESPIVTVEKKVSDTLAKSIAPNIDKIGVFLAYTPLHILLLEAFGKAVVATSANISDEPIITDEAEVEKKLSLVVEATLTHNREIVNASDDTVMMSIDDKRLFLRLARGYGPKSFYNREGSQKRILAVGANQKNTITLAFENNMILSPHIGDLSSLEAFNYFKRTLELFKKLYSFEPDVIVCDKHPRYETRLWAKEYAESHSSVELIELQHHYAHALSVMAEYALDERVLAFCFDGTGYGDDGSLWGGEVLLASTKEYERIYHLQELYLLGGEKAVREPRRVGLSLLFDSFSLDEILQMDIALVKSFTKEELSTLHTMFQRKINSPKSSSIGRLFDGVYALSGFVEELGYEGESGLIMERLSRESDSQERYSYMFDGSKIEYKMMVREILQESSVARVAKKFINTIKAIILDISKDYPHLPVVLSGGVFQNSVLVDALIKEFDASGRRYYIQSQTPINDGSISLGQAYYAVKKFNRESN